MASPPQDSAKPQTGDPAMDDILASIRRILNEDEAQGGTQGGAAGEPVAEPLQLTEAMMVEPTPAAAPAAPIAEAAPVAVPAVAPAAAPLGADSLVAPAVAAATTAAVGQLLRAVAQERSAPIHRGGPSIEDVVREELRPLLKDWLDQHLPPIVERLVRVEIERVVGRGLS